MGEREREGWREGERGREGEVERRGVHEKVGERERGLVTGRENVQVDRKKVCNVHTSQFSKCEILKAIRQLLESCPEHVQVNACMSCSL